MIFQDNMSTIAKVRQSEIGGNDRKEHFKKRRLLVKELVDEGKIRIKHVPARAMIADVLTKPLQGELFRRLRDAVSNYDRRKSRDACSSYGGVSTNV